MQGKVIITISILQILIHLKHIKSFSDIASILYKFENNKIVSFQDNFKFMGDLSFVVYYDFDFQSAT